jgi:hypothetical protein
MVKDLFDTLQAVVERLGVCLILLNSVGCLGSSKLAAWFHVKLLANFTLLYKKSLVCTITSDRETNLPLIEEFFFDTFF